MGSGNYRTEASETKRADRHLVRRFEVCAFAHCLCYLLVLCIREMHLLYILLLLCGLILPHRQEELHRSFACMLEYVACAYSLWPPHSILDTLACIHDSPNLGAAWQMCSGRCVHALTRAPPCAVSPASRTRSGGRVNSLSSSEYG